LSYASTISKSDRRRTHTISGSRRIQPLVRFFSVARNTRTRDSTPRALAHRTREAHTFGQRLLDDIHRGMRGRNLPGRVANTSEPGILEELDTAVNPVSGDRPRPAAGSPRPRLGRAPVREVPVTRRPARCPGPTRDPGPANLRAAGQTLVRTGSWVQKPEHTGTRTAQPGEARSHGLGGPARAAWRSRGPAAGLQRPRFFS